MSYAHEGLRRGEGNFLFQYLSCWGGGMWSGLLAGRFVSYAYF